MVLVLERSDRLHHRLQQRRAGQDFDPVAAAVTRYRSQPGSGIAGEAFGRMRQGRWRMSSSRRSTV